MGSMRLLTLNSGSSSVKAALYDARDNGEILLLSMNASRIGSIDGTLTVQDAHGQTLLDDKQHLSSHLTVIQTIIGFLSTRSDDGQLDGVAHRVVHGGEKYREPCLITPDVVATLRSLVPLAPEHLPSAINGIEAVTKLNARLPQVACFDTAFHAHLPPVAYRYALPRALTGEGVRRYGFHGLSYEYVVSELTALDPASTRRAIIAHLGNGASMAAVRGGQSADTSMGFTPTAGLVMGTRVGDLDPGVVLYLEQHKGMGAEDVETLLNKQSGLLGVSGTSADMRDLLARAPLDAHAAEAIALFCYQAKKYIGAYAAVLGGLDTLVFTGGIGENSAVVRANICDGLRFLGIELDDTCNASSEAVISHPGSPVTVRVVKTDEDLMIARHARRVLSQTQ